MRRTTDQKTKDLYFRRLESKENIAIALRKLQAQRFNAKERRLKAKERRLNAKEIEDASRQERRLKAKERRLNAKEIEDASRQEQVKTLLAAKKIGK
jgi:hypothetical protein